MAEKDIKKVDVAVPELPMRSDVLHSSHVTTMNFMQTLPVFYREIPKGGIKHTPKNFTRLFPCKRPVLGSGHLSINSFFVPYRTIWPVWTDFITDTPHNDTSGTWINNTVPTIQNSELITFFTYSHVATITLQTAYDFTQGGNNYKLTPFGRYALKLLEGLGYKVMFDSKVDFRVEALTFLSYIKCYQDWYFPSQYAHTGVYATIDGIFQRNIRYDLTALEINQLIQAVRYVAYDTDIFVGAFDNPVGGANGTFSRDFSIKDISSFNTFTNSFRSDVVPTIGNEFVAQSAMSVNDSFSSLQGSPGIHPYVRTADGTGTYSATPITSYSLDVLNALNSYIMRNQLAGSRALDRYLARYGKVLDADKLQRSYYLGSTKSPIEFGAVTANADTYNSNNGEGAPLGYMSGKGAIVDYGTSFECDTDEWGMYICIASINPDIAYYQGYDPNRFHLSKLDFHTAEFSGIGNTAIPTCVVGVAMKNPSYNTTLKGNVFGFAPRYYEYSIPVDHVTGDFRCDSVNGGLDAWITARTLAVESMSSPNDLTHSLDFCIGNDAYQYSRIFYSREEDGIDNFYCVFRNDFELRQPVRALYDSYDWHEKTSKEVKLDVNGAKVN